MSTKPISQQYSDDEIKTAFSEAHEYDLAVVENKYLDLLIIAHDEKIQVMRQLIETSTELIQARRELLKLLSDSTDPVSSIL